MNNWKYNHPFRNIFSWMMIFFLFSGGLILFLFNKEQLFWGLNQQHTFPGDVFFSYFTHVGDGMVILALGVLMLGLGKRKLGIMLLATFVLSGLLAQSIKRFKPEPRPGRYFTHIERIHKVSENPLTGNNSFPSGHTTTAFAMFSMLAFASRTYTLPLIYFLLALMVGYSRIYLGQHFFKDVLIGAFLGYLSSLFILWLFRKKDFGS